MEKYLKCFKRVTSVVVCLLMLLNMLTFVCAAETTVLAKLYWAAEFDQAEWSDAEGENAQPVFNIADLEPGSEVVRYFKVKNAGSLAFSYALKLASAEVGDLAEVIDVYCKSAVSANTLIAEMGEPIGTLADVINNSAFASGSILPMNLTGDGFYTNETVVAVGLKMHSNAAIKYQNASAGEFSVELTATECDFTYPEIDKFRKKFPNTDSYLYRVGNVNEVKLGSLFEAVEGASQPVGNVSVAVEKLDPDTDVDYTYTKNADWTKSAIKFTGTGPVSVTVSDDRWAKPVVLYLEVINAKNLTSAESVSSNNAVLLQNVTFSTLDVKNGYTLYGNGFELYAPNDVSYYDWAYAFVTLEDGTLDNVKVICPNFSYQVMYSSNVKDSGNTKNPSQTDHYFNVRSAVKMKGNSKIINSYVSGGRAAIFATSGNPVIDNSTIYGGAAANIQVITVNNLLLKDTTLIQEPIQANVNDTSKTIMGLSVFFEADGDGNTSPVTIEGDFVQYAWANEEYKKYVPSAASSFVSSVYSMTDFKHSVTYKDGVTRDSFNLGFISIPSDYSVSANIPDINEESRNNKETVPYKGGTVSKAAFYTYENSKGTDSAFGTYPVYKTGASANIHATVNYDDSTDGVSFATKHEAGGGWKSTLTVDLDAVEGGTYTVDFDKLAVRKYGRILPYTIKDSSGNVVENKEITLSDTISYSYVIEITDNIYYGADGQVIGEISETYTHDLLISATKTSILPPENKTTSWEDPLLVVKSYDSDWSAAIPASLSTINVYYYSKNEKTYKTLNLGGIVPTSTGKQNGNNNYWEYTGPDYSLKITCGFIHEGKSVAGMPVVVKHNDKNKMYFVITDTNGYVSTSTAARAVTLTYEFTDGNQNTIKFTHTFNANRQNIKDGNQGSDSNQYSYSDFVNGKLTATSSDSGGGCFAEGTLITLADGSQKAIEKLTFEDEILVWDFFEGKYTTSVPTLLINDGVKDYDIIKLNFDDGKSLRIIYEHGLFAVEKNDYVLINADNSESFIGQNFVKYNGVTNEIVKLESVEITNEKIGCRTILSALHNNCIANGLLTVTPPPIVGFYDYFKIGEGMKYDEYAMRADVEKYGLYTYDDFKKYISYDEFVAFNGAYLKLPVAKGYFTFDDIIEQIKKFGVGVFAPVALALDDSGTASAVTITLGGNTISSASYEISVSSDNATLADGVYTCNADECLFTLSATGTATTGYAKITIGEDVYYTKQIASGESFVINFKNAKGKTVSVEIFWGKSQDAGVNQETLIESGFEVEYTFAVEIKASNAELGEDGKYTCLTNESVFTLTANGTAASGYAVITVDGDAYYTQKIVPGEEFTVNVKNAMGKTIEIAVFCGDAETEDDLIESGATIDCGEVKIASLESIGNNIRAIITNTTKTNITGTVHIAAYDKETGAMVDLKSENVIVPAKDKAYSPEVEDSDNYTIKVFLWKIGKMIPLVNSFFCE